MNYDATIRQLEQKRDFYAAAVTALKQIAQYEQAATATTAPAPKRGRRSGYKVSAEARARMAAAQQARQARARAAKANGADHSAPITSAPVVQ